jgi:hypothetical protein
VTEFLLSLAAVAGVLLAASAAGWFACRALFPGGREFLTERIGWSLAAACLLLAAPVPVALLLGARPGWVPFLLGAAVMFTASLLLPLPPGEGRGEGKTEASARQEAPRWVLAFLFALALLGILLYTLRALTEPMWSNDFLAIWGFKGKTIFLSGSLPSRLHDWAPIRFSHPEYPLGLPLLYAGISFLTGNWDDHAMALVFPLFQIATLCALGGWLRRQGVSQALALCAAVLVALFAPLYSAFLTGMAEIPLAFGLLLFGTAFADAFEQKDGGALRRLAFASVWIAAIKNEGLFLAAAAFSITLLSGGSRRLKVGLAALAPALGVYGLHLAWRGRVPLSDFDFALFSPARVSEALAAAVRIPGLSGWLGLAAFAVLVASGSRTPASDRLLLLAACALCAYLALPVFAILGPAWLVETTLGRTAAALAPLLAAGVALRIAASTGGSSGSA